MSGLNDQVPARGPALAARCGRTVKREARLASSLNHAGISTIFGEHAT
jgi:hypothetical protein